MIEENVPQPSSWDIGDDTFDTTTTMSQYSSEQDELLKRRQERDSTLIEKIKERSETTLAENVDRATRIIVDEYLSHEQQGNTVPDSVRVEFVKMAMTGELKQKLEQKAAEFAATYETTVFNKLIHGVPKDLGQEVVLKSSSVLAAEKGEAVETVAVSSSSLDTQLGNTDYVFANSAALISRSMLGTNVYQITSQDGYVVPIDFADLQTPDEPPQFDSDEETYRRAREKFFDVDDHNRLETYSNNIYKISDFKKVFSMYTASFFDTPAEALAFFRKYRGETFMSGAWVDNGGMIQAATSEKDKQIAIRMQMLYKSQGIFPPIVPEFQFKDSVTAVKLPENDVAQLFNQSA